MHYKAIVTYNGTNFHGWAKQPNTRTIESEIENAFKAIFNETVKLNVAGRTDAWVHAKNQVFDFNLETKMSNIAICKALNSKLSDDVYIKSIKKADKNFHSRYSAKWKQYSYYINTGPYNPIEKDIVYQYNKTLDIKLIKKILPSLAGKHDFLSFSTSEIEDTVREIKSIKIIKKSNIVVITFNSNGFLRYMVRMLVGNLIAISENKITETNVKYFLENPRKGSSIYKAPGCGLFLEKIYYF